MVAGVGGQSRSYLQIQTHHRRIRFVSHLWEDKQAKQTGYILVLFMFNYVSSQVFPYLAAHRALYNDTNQAFYWVDTEQLLSDLP